MSVLLLVGVGKMGRPYLEAARRLGIRTCAVELATRSASIAALADDVAICRGEHDELWAEAAMLAADAHRPRGVLAFSEFHVIGAAMVQEELGLPGPSLRAAMISRNKGLQRACFARAGITQPEYLLTNRLDADSGWVEPRLPVMIKPVSMTGSAGVELVRDGQEFGAASERRNCEGRLLLETEVTGPEYSWEALLIDGEVWLSNVTAKETTGPPYFVEVAHLVPADLNPEDRRSAEALGRSVTQAIGMRTGMVHLEFRLSPSGPAPMEVAVRTPGDWIMNLLGCAYGFDWFEMAVRAALGMPLPDPQAGPSAHAASYLPVAAPGTVRAVEGLEDIRRMPEVISASVSASPGSVVPPARHSLNRVGSVVLAAADREAVTAALQRIRRELVVSTD